MAGRPGQTDVPSYLGWSIFNTVCCCLPLGIAAIIYSTKVNSANSAGNEFEAEDASRMAKKLNIFGFFIGIILIIIYIIYLSKMSKDPK
uniref:Uncharacterized protein n=1 Tax=Oryzias latipes TaxID=8090 RepID=A0A3B3I1G4_ORYLA